MRWTKSITSGGEFLALVLLEEVPPVGDGGVVLAPGPGHQITEDPVGAVGDGIAIAERAQEGLVELAQDLPCSAVGVGGGIVGARRHQHGELAGPFFERLVGEGRVVGRDHLGCQVRHRSAVDDATHGQGGDLLGEFLPGQEGLTHVQVARG